MTISNNKVYNNIYLLLPAENELKRKEAASQFKLPPFNMKTEKHGIYDFRLVIAKI